MSKQMKNLSSVSPVLTNEKLSEILSDWFRENIHYTHWEYVSSCGRGDSYLSEIMRINLFGTNHNGNNRNVQIFLKHIPKSISRRLSFRSDEFFRNEVNFYNIVLPALLNFQSSKNLKDPFTSHVKPLYAYTDGMNDVICVEDVSPHGFRNAMRQNGIDYEHSKISLKSLAEFHALSFAVMDQNPKEFNKIKNAVQEIYYDERLWDWYERFWKRVCAIAVDAVEKEYPNTVYVEKIKEFAIPETFKAMAQAAKSNESSVICHGDTWTNNFLYKYENKRPVDAKIIDFQLVRYASPVLDLAVFIYACTTQDLRLKHYDELIKFYYTVLSRRIRELGSDPYKLYSWEKYLEEIQKYSFLGLAFSLESTPLIVLPPEEALNMDLEGDEVVNIDDVWQIQPFKTKEGRRREADNVVFCVDKGYI